MRHGTQEELDAAREDATLLPFDAVFLTKEAINNPSDLKIGAQVWRKAEPGIDTKGSVRFDCNNDFWFLDANDLEVIK